MGNTSLWKIQLFGGLTVEKEGEKVTFRDDFLGRLLAFLVIGPREIRDDSESAAERVYSRAQLARALWDWDDASARNSLSNLKNKLTQTLEKLSGEEFVRGTSATIQLAWENIETDVGLFEQNLRAARQAKEAKEQVLFYTRALKGYRPFLEGFEKDAWILKPRARLRAKYLNANARFAEALLRMGEWDKAIEAARRVVSAPEPHPAEPDDPSFLKAHLALMCGYSLLGEPEQAQAARQLFRSRLSGLETKYAELSEAAERIHAAALSGPAVLLGILEGVAGGASIQASTSGAVRGSGIQSLPLPPLPTFYSAFVGRSEEIAEIESLLALREETTPLPVNRLVTIVGPGGVGKTHLAVCMAQKQRDEGRMPVWYVSFEHLATASLLYEVMAEQMQLPKTAQTSEAEVIAALGSRPSLLILDNMEHLTDVGADLIYHLLSAVSSLRCLATSRSPLGGDEQLYPLSGLPVTEVCDNLALTKEKPGVQLFEAVARMKNKDFRLSEQNYADVARICRELDGLPLYIRSAAAQSRTLAPSDMADRLQADWNWFGQPATPARRSSVAEIARWSLTFLPDDTRDFLVGLAIFCGPFTQAAAEYVCGASGASTHFARLQGELFVETEDKSGRQALRLPAPTRRYALQLLSDQQRSVLTRRHLEYYVAALSAQPASPGSEEIAIVGAEYPNIREALRRSLAAPDLYPLGIRLAGKLGTYWLQKDLFREGREWLEAFIQRGLPEEAMRQESSDILFWASVMAVHRGDRAAARAYIERCLTLREDNTEGMALALNAIGNIVRSSGDNADARKYHQRAYEILICLRESEPRPQKRETLDFHLQQVLCNLGIDAEKANDGENTGILSAIGYYKETLRVLRRCDSNRQKWASWVRAYNNLGNTYLTADRYKEADACYEEAYALATKADSEMHCSQVRFAQGGLAIARRQYDRAYECYVESERLCRKLGEANLCASVLQIGWLTYWKKDIPRALVYLQESLDLAYDVEDRDAGMYVVNTMGLCYAAQKRDQNAVKCWAFAQALSEQNKIPINFTPGERSDYNKRIREVKKRLGAAYETLWNEASTVSWDTMRDTLNTF